MPDFAVNIIEWVAGLAPALQVAALFLLGAIPWIESYFGGPAGMILGINPFLAVPAAIIGNIACTFLLIALAGRARNAATRNRQSESAEPPSKRQQKVAKFMDRFGVPGVCLLGPALLASQIVAPALVGLGANRRSVYIWAGTAITLWGVGAGLLMAFLLGLADYQYLDY